MTARPGAFVISLDFELHWGVRDRHAADSPYADVLRTTREVIPQILDLFREYDIAATWATVGFLFARSAEEMRSYSPELRPTYDDARLDPYNEPIGADELGDPIHFAPSLIKLIRSTPRQEIATHTFSHYYCGEPGQTRDQFEADLQSAVRIARDSGIELESIVYPRNQHNPDYAELLRASGIVAYRGNPEAWMWRFDNTSGSGNVLMRMGRMADSYVSLTGDGSVGWNELKGDAGLVNVRASAFLRPFDPRMKHLEGLRLRRIERAMTSAAKRKRIVHLWWHPHNMGSEVKRNLGFLQSILQHHARLRDRYGVESLSMAEVATFERTLPTPSDAAIHYETTRSDVKA